jgi:hypothetical protein
LIKFQKEFAVDRTRDGAWLSSGLIQRREILASGLGIGALNGPGRYLPPHPKMPGDEDGLTGRP